MESSETPETMHDAALDVPRDAALLSVLAAYGRAGESAKTAAPESDGWIQRLRTVDGVDATLLSPVHGRMIAYGLVRFQISGPTVGMVYQLTPLGRSLIDPRPVLSLLEIEPESSGEGQAA